jgi:membrane associated rhomboid family serine protease
MFRLTPVVKNLLIINVVVFILPLVVEGLEGFIEQNFPLFYVEGDLFRPWQIITYMFLHASGGHIFGNMIGLVIFGPWLEELFGSKRFLTYYLVTGVGAGLLFMGTEFIENRGVKEDVNSFLLEPSANDFEVMVMENFPQFYYGVAELMEQYSANPQNEAIEQEAINATHQMYEATLNVPMVGASGAVFGLILAVGLLFPLRQIMLLIPPIPLKVRTFAILYGAFEVYSVIQNAPNDNIAHYAHLGGMLVGYIVLVIWGEAQNRYR